MAAILPVSASAFQPIDPEKIDALDRLPFITQEEAKRCLLTAPLPASGTFIFHRLSNPPDTRALFACTRIVHEAGGPMVYTEYFGLNVRTNQFYLIRWENEQMQFVGPGWNDLASLIIMRGGFRKLLSPQICSEITARYQEVANTFPVFSTQVPDILRALDAAPPGVFFIENVSACATYMIWQKTQLSAVAKIPLTIAFDGTLMIWPPNQRPEAFSNFRQMADELELGSSLQQWEAWMRQQQESRPAAGAITCPTAVHGPLPLEILQLLAASAPR
jgi:hypothetical protein